MKTLGVAMLGHGFMGQAHSRALAALAHMEERPAAVPRLVSICGRDRPAVERARALWGWEAATGEWSNQLSDERVAVFDNVAPNALHLGPCLAALDAGKHVLCEKPLGRDAGEARRLRDAAREAGVAHMCGFNLRFVPAVRLARDMIEAGDLGDITHFRGRFLASSALRRDQACTWRFAREEAGSGAVADLGSHLVDLCRYLAGEPAAVSAATRTFVPARDGETVDVDDAFAAVLELAGGAIGTIEASRAAGRRSNECSFQVDGTRGSLEFDVERLNSLDIVLARKRATRIDVTETQHPFMDLWWPAPGHPIGWGDSFVHELRHFLAAAAESVSVGPHGADFEDGYRCAVVCDAILEAAGRACRTDVTAS